MLFAWNVLQVRLLFSASCISVLLIWMFLRGDFANLSFVRVVSSMRLQNIIYSCYYVYIFHETLLPKQRIIVPCNIYEQKNP